MKNVIMLFFFQTVFYGYSQVDSVRFNNCKLAGSNKIQNRIISIEKENNLLNYKIGIVGNCVLDSNYFLYLHWFDSDTLALRIKYNETKTLCECYYELDFTVNQSVENEHPILKFDNSTLVVSPHLFKLVPVKFQIVEGDTINYFDQFGFENGKHVLFNEMNLAKSVIYFRNGQRIWEADFDKNKKMKNIIFYQEEKRLENISENRLNRLMKKKNRTIKQRKNKNVSR